MADVTINYEGNAIATMSASGTKTLQTQGKYCTDDIEVVYVSPGGGGGSVNAETGTVTIMSEVSAPSVSTPFPGIQLSFQAEFICIFLEYSSIDMLSQPSSYLYYMVSAVRNLFPPLRIDSTHTTDTFSSSIENVTMGTSSFTNSTTSPSGYGMGTSNGVSPEERAGAFTFNADGTFNYRGISSAVITKLIPGTYRYIAFRRS